MGVSVLWADRNIGAESVFDYGRNFNWGVTDISGNEKAPSTLSNYPNNISGTNFDIATTNFGEGWRTPTLDEYNELLKNCEVYRFEHDGVSGYLLISKTNKNELFFPNYKRYEIKGDSTSDVFGSDRYPVYWTADCIKSYNGGFVFDFIEDERNAYRPSFYLPVRVIKNK